jgi:hypothetical protein
MLHLHQETTITDVVSSDNLPTILQTCAKFLMLFCDSPQTPQASGIHAAKSRDMAWQGTKFIFVESQQFFLSE